MRRWLSGLVASGVVAVALVVWHQRPVESCLTVEFDGVTYTEAATTEEVISGDELGDGTLRCGTYERPIAVSRTPGLDPDLAVASPIAAHVVFLAPGVSLQDLPEKFGTVRSDS